MSVALLHWGMVYHCAKCAKWYRKGNVMCCVMHAPGDCCHYGDQEVHEPRPVLASDPDTARRPLDQAP